MRINKRGFWEGQVEHRYCSGLSHEIIRLARERNLSKVCDFGCGAGDYVNAIKKAGINCVGYDGNTFFENVVTIDLSSSFDLGVKFPLVLCLEVGEHIPEIYEGTSEIQRLVIARQLLRD